MRERLNIEQHLKDVINIIPARDLLLQWHSPTPMGSEYR